MAYVTGYPRPLTTAWVWASARAREKVASDLGGKATGVPV